MLEKCCKPTLTSLKITQMAQNKFENQIKEKLEAREIQPSEKSWDRLDAMLSVAEEKKTKRFPFFTFQSIGIAASVLVLLSLGLYFFNQKETISNAATDVVVKEEIKNKDNDKNKFNVNTKPEIVVQQDEQVAETTNNKPQTTNHNLSSKSFNQINQKTTVNSIINQKKEIEYQFSEVIAQKDMPKVISQDKIEVSKAENFIKNETPYKNSNSKSIKVNATDLLASVENELKSTNDSKKLKIKVDSNSLLSQVDGELEQTFREKVLSRINKNYQEVKVALANRNQEK
jgi:negative regulator of sigma E activity